VAGAGTGSYRRRSLVSSRGVSGLARIGTATGARCWIAAYVVRELASGAAVCGARASCAGSPGTLGSGFVWTLRGWRVDPTSANANARHAALKAIGIVGGLYFATRILFADGGIVQFQKQAGPFFVTVFSAPVPLRIGPADLSVMVQRADDRREVLDCRVILHFTKTNERDIEAPATRAQAKNKLLYAAPIVFPSAGQWHLTVDITEGGDTVRLNGELAVLPELPTLIAHWPYFALLPIAVALFGLNQWLKARRKARSPRARP
jgi:hypothetical protein